MKKVYELGGKYIKTTYYSPLLSPVVHEQNIFAIQDNGLHKERRRKISPMYTMSSMVSYEPAVDEMTHVCIRKLNQFAKEGRLVDIPHWMQYYAFDVIGAITVSLPPSSPLKVLTDQCYVVQQEFQHDGERGRYHRNDKGHSGGQ